ncbi:LacI family DNA-binding transcriptional regulator [Halocynthiibacter sp. C4]|uniref:LacI family DNA-binding transcriptional regulator n=1 Tax=Halocynthiibacter sp. C4 TaxID=2992758 RepID=UPI00237C2E8C|nr:LacI family DNA-binding transcriptional regulator [Halocynthiibacter sp. C4]MDE0590540.1 LacI family DNA-binding transcriptional regulator [Halocynthiibacter sp. C4]
MGASSDDKSRNPRQSESGTVSIRDVAKRAGVSIASVSRALNSGSGSVSKATQEKVAAAAQALNYRPNQAGRALRSQSTNTYALINSNIQNNFYAAIAWELERLLSAEKSALLVYTSNEDAETQDRCIEDIRSRQVSGVFFLCAVDSPGLTTLTKNDPVVFINRRLRSCPEISFVGIDDEAAARAQMRSGARRDLRNIAIIHGPESSDTSARRLRGMLDAARDAGANIAPNAIKEARLSMESGYDCAGPLLDDKNLDAIFCGNDQIAYGVYRRCLERGIAVPDQLRIYGFDDNPMNEWLAPWLNTVRVPHVELARTAVEQMQTLTGNGAAREILLPYELIQRA